MESTEWGNTHGGNDWEKSQSAGRQIKQKMKEKTLKQIKE